MTLPPEKSPDDIWDIIELVGIFGVILSVILPWIVMIALLTGYQEAKGTLKGTAKERQRWKQWYTQRQNTERQDLVFEEPLLENTQVSQKALALIIRNPLPFVIHFSFWFFASVLLNTLPFHFGPLEVAKNLVGPLPQLAIISIILALIAGYQEAKGTVKGTAKEAEAWTKWYQRQIEAKAHGYFLDEMPPTINGSNRSIQEPS